MFSIRRDATHIFTHYPYPIAKTSAPSACPGKGLVYLVQRLCNVSAPALGWPTVYVYHSSAASSMLGLAAEKSEMISVSNGWHIALENHADMVRLS